MWFFKKNKKKETEQDILVQRIKAEKYDLQGLFSNINNRAEVEVLYKELSKQSHPDKYENDLAKQEIAKELFAEVQNNRNNYHQLMELKTIIEVKLVND